MFNGLRSKISKAVDNSQSFIKGWVDMGGYKPNWFQLGQSAPTTKDAIHSSGVYACVATLAQEVARLRMTHFTNPGLEGQIEMYQSDITKLLLNPNSYQTRTDFFLSLMFSLLMNGNSYGLATRDRKGEVISITPLNPEAVQPFVVPDTGEIFYSVSQMDIDPVTAFDPTTFVPQRDMLHIRLFTPTHPLMGVTPLTACMMSVEHGLSIQENATTFFKSGSKPSGILRTPKPLTPAQGNRIREAWREGTSGVNAGKVPVLDNDLQFQQMSLSAADAQLIEQYGMTKRDIAIVFRVPLYMVGEGDVQFKTAEASQRDFTTRALGFYLEHIEASLNQFFGFDGRTEQVEFDVERGIMRPEFLERIEGLVKGIQGGLTTPDEARKSEGRKKLPGGDKLYMQRQNVPIELLGLDVLSMLNGDESTEEADDTEEDSNDIDEKNLRLHLGLPA